MSPYAYIKVQLIRQSVIRLHAGFGLQVIYATNEEMMR